MTSKSRDNSSEIGTPDYAVELKNIKEGVMIMNPASGTAKSLLQTSEELDNAAWIDFSEIRYFLEPVSMPQPGVRPPFPLTAKEIEMMRAIESAGGDSRNYEVQFYSPFKEAIGNGVRNRILFKISRDHRDATITEDSATGIIKASWPIGVGYHDPQQQVGRSWDVRKVVDSLVMYLPYQDLADMADSYFSTSFLSTSDTWAAKIGYFALIQRHFFEGYDGWKLDMVYGDLSGGGVPSYIASVSVPDIWAQLKEKIINQFGSGSEDIGALEDAFTFQPPIPPAEFPFMTFPAGDINLGLRLVYRQEWRPLGIQRGEVVRTIPLGPKQTEKVSSKIVRRSKVTKTSENLKSTETTTETSDTAKDSSEIVNQASSAMKWNVNAEVEGSFNIGVGSIGGKTSGGYSKESTDSSQETSTRLSETMQKIANKVRTETKVVVSTEFETTFEATSASEIQNPNDEIAITYVFSKLQRQYEILTRLAEVQDVIMVAEELPPPEKIDFDWVKRHDWIIAKVLLDDSFRDALNSISQEAGQPDMKTITTDLLKARDETIKHLGAFASTEAAVTATNIDFAGESQKAFLGTAKEQLERLRQNYLLDANRYRLIAHIRENILYYYRAIWQHEDPQQRLLRYQKQGTTVPLDWYFWPELRQQMDIDDFTTLFGANSKSWISGEFVADMQGRRLPLTDLINPAGPIAFYGNYAVYYLRPEYAGNSDIMALLKIFKEPYGDSDGNLLDPRQRQIAKEWAGKTDAERTTTIDECWEDMIDHVPELRLNYLQEKKAQPDDGEEDSALDLLGYETFNDFYPEYQFRKEQSRRFLVDTNCLMIDLLPGEGSALEPFKQMHRAIDVLKAERELMKMSLDNERRQRLIDAGQYGDPDIEKVTIVADPKAANGLVATCISTDVENEHTATEPSK